MQTSTLTRPLYKHVDDYLSLLSWMDDNADQLTAAGGELPDGIADRLDQIEGSIQEKVERTALVIRNLQRNADGAEAEERTLRTLKTAYRRQAEYLKAYLKHTLRRAAIDRIDAPRAKVWIQTSATPVVRPTNPDRIPAKYLIPPTPQPPTFDRDTALADLRAAGLIPNGPTDEPLEIDGLTIERGCHVRIR